MDMVWPVKRIKLGRGIPGVWESVASLTKSDEVFVQRYTEDDEKSGYIYISSYDEKDRTLRDILERYSLRMLKPFVKRGELLLMW